MKNNWDIGIGIALALIGFAIFTMSFSLGSQQWGAESARIFPQVVSAVIFLLSLQLIREGWHSVNFRPVFNAMSGHVFWLFLTATIYIALIEKIGYVLATAVIAPAAFWLFGERSPKFLLVSSILCPVAMHLIFFVGLEIYPPVGEYFDLIEFFQAAK
jgi:hypothetical protein